MQELTFETILRLPQMELKKRLKAELKSRGYHITDKPGYLYAEGTIPVLLVAHMDTVHRQPVEQVCYSADGAVAMSPQGIGGDDRCGVWIILQILRTANCHVLFCEDEEVGCVGAKKFTRGSLRPQVNYIVELDRRGSNDAVFYRCDNPEFEDFVSSFGFETANGSCSDISYIAPYLETAAVNISCGYYCEHQRHEYIHLEEMELNAARVAGNLNLGRLVQLSCYPSGYPIKFHAIAFAVLQRNRHTSEEAADSHRRFQYISGSISELFQCLHMQAATSGGV